MRFFQACPNKGILSVFAQSTYQNHKFSSQLSSRISARKSQALHMEPKRDERQNSSIESVYMSSDDADSMRETRLGKK